MRIPLLLLLALLALACADDEPVCPPFEAQVAFCAQTCIEARHAGDLSIEVEHPICGVCHCETRSQDDIEHDHPTPPYHRNPFIWFDHWHGVGWGHDDDGDDG